MKFIFNDPLGNEHLSDNDPQNQSGVTMNPSTKWPPPQPRPQGFSLKKWVGRPTHFLREKPWGRGCPPAPSQVINDQRL